MNDGPSLQSRRRRRTILYGVAAICLIAGISILAMRDAREPPEDHARRLERQHGITIGFGSPDSFYVPPYEEAIPSSSAYSPAPAERDAVAVALVAIEESLRQYPPGFVSKLIGGIFVCGELRMDGAEAGGTVGPRWIILAAPRKLGVEGIQLTSRIGVHHELSSIVYHLRPTTELEWLQFAPKDCAFTASSDAALKRFADAAPPPSTGFLSAYGATTPENDFNVYAEKIFTEPAMVRNAAEAEPLVSRKLAYVMNLYGQIDPRMLDVFKNLGLRVDATSLDREP